jgi:hypothetical protein
MADRKEKEAQKERQGTTRNEAKRPPRRNPRNESYDSPTIFFNNYHGSGNNSNKSDTTQLSMPENDKEDAGRASGNNFNHARNVSPLLQAQGFGAQENKKRPSNDAQSNRPSNQDAEKNAGQDENQFVRKRRGSRQLSSPEIRSVDAPAAPTCPFALLQVGVLLLPLIHAPCIILTYAFMCSCVRCKYGSASYVPTFLEKKNIFKTRLHLLLPSAT